MRPSISRLILSSLRKLEREIACESRCCLGWASHWHCIALAYWYPIGSASLYLLQLP
jgi:hypothetical protein